MICVDICFTIFRYSNYTYTNTNVQLLTQMATFGGAEAPTAHTLTALAMAT